MVCLELHVIERAMYLLQTICMHCSLDINLHQERLLNQVIREVYSYLHLHIQIVFEFENYMYVHVCMHVSVIAKK